MNFLTEAAALHRTIMSEHFGSLALPVGEFLALEHGTEYHGCLPRPLLSSGFLRLHP
jgi:hypothetical protein